MVSEPSDVMYLGLENKFNVLIMFMLRFNKKITSFTKYDAEFRQLIGWISVKRANGVVSRGAGPQSSSGGFPSAHSS